MSESELNDLRESLTLERDESHRRWCRIKDLEAENVKLRECLQEIATHSVCCDARHMADKILKGGEE